MKLGELISGLDIVSVSADLDTEVTGLVADSRKVTEGSVFVAVRGYESDGHRFIDAAVAAGAAAVIGEEVPEGVPSVTVRDSRRAMAAAAGNLYGNPSRRMKMIGVTGTNGKTTTTNLIKTVLEETLGVKVGLIGTNRNMIGSEEFETDRTTPDCLELQALLRQMADEGCEYVVMEVSSHALYLDRVYGIRFMEGIFTNLTEDHLDFHRTMEEYAKAKSRLFTMCDRAIINIDDPWSDTMLKAATGEIYTYSAKSDEADLTARDIKLHASSVSFCALMTGKLEKIRLGIPGMFSVYNALAATAACICAGVTVDKVKAALCDCAGVKGRAEVVPTGTDYTVLIDYAHTPDALENILKTVRGFTKGRVIVLFGCGGDRDPVKRPIMGEIAERLSDYVIVTSDNPRTERPEAIIDEIMKGIKGENKPVEVICDRREAIARALDIAKAGDTVVLAGKGHETYQEIDHVKHHLDEREVVAEYFKNAKAM